MAKTLVLSLTSRKTVDSNRQPELDYLRGLACAMVVFSHYLERGARDGLTGLARYPWAESIAEWGYLGVQLFFMISGYVIFKSAQDRTAGSFIISRFWRLYPAYWVAIACTTIVVTLFKATHFQVSTRDLIWNFSMFQQFANAANVDGVYWSLLVELLFYLYVAAAISLRILSYTYTIIFAWLAVCVANLFLQSFWIDTLALARWGPYFIICIQ